MEKDPRLQRSLISIEVSALLSWSEGLAKHDLMEKCLGKGLEGADSPSNEKASSTGCVLGLGLLNSTTGAPTAEPGRSRKGAVIAWQDSDWENL